MSREVDVSVGDIGMWRLLHGGPVCWWGRWGAMWMHVADRRWWGSVHGLSVGISPGVCLVVLLLLGGAAGLFGLGGSVVAIVGVGLILGVVMWVVWVVVMLATRGTDVSIRGLNRTEVFPTSVRFRNQRSILRELPINQLGGPHAREGCHLSHPLMPALEGSPDKSPHRSPFHFVDLRTETVNLLEP